MNHHEIIRKDSFVRINVFGEELDSFPNNFFPFILFPYRFTFVLTSKTPVSR